MIAHVGGLPVEEVLPALMTGVTSLRVPLVVDVGSGRNWERAH